MEAILVLDFIFFFLFSICTHNPQFLLASSITIGHTQNFKGNESDYEALLAIKSKISKDPNSVFTSWKESLHFCHWEGITCGRMHRRVVGLDLSSSKLVGTLSPYIGNLSFLRVLNLTNNFIHGDIPPQISLLPRLQKLSLSNNSFEGEIPANLSSCLHLVQLDLRNNNLSGRIPAQLASLPNLREYILDSNTLSGRLQDIGIGNMSISLEKLSLYQNLLQGSIPDDIGRLQNLSFLGLGYNMLSGTIPSSLKNLSRLEVLYLGNNNIHGHLPQDIGLRSPRLRRVLMWNNSLIGKVPTSLSNPSKLAVLDISYNKFVGKFFLNGNNLPHLSALDIDYAFQSGDETRDLSFLDTLTNCTKLVDLRLGGNSFTGAFPHSILNLSADLNWLSLQNNQISGELPHGLGKFVNLYGLGIHYNHFTGLIPFDIGKLKSVEVIFFDHNNFSGQVPCSLGNLTRLSTLSMIYNNLDGPLPKSLGNCQFLQSLHLASNKFSGIVPIELFQASGLFELGVEQNNLHGPLPIEISRLEHLIQLDVSHNKLSGEIPSTLGRCLSLNFLGMSGNSFVGSIPESLNPLKNIQYLDLSCNNLSGQIPSYFSTWPYLLSLNLSFNYLEGEVPAHGVFVNMSGSLIVGNNNLCGGVLELHLPRCPSPKESKRRRLSLAVIVILSLTCVLIIFISLALCFYLLSYPRKRKDASSELQMINPFLQVSYQMLSRATNGFSPANLLGAGGFGSVYKGALHQDESQIEVAIKVMNHQNKGASKSFIAECNALRNIRHRNLVKIITACSSIDTQRNDFKALVYDFIPRGSLESWLHPTLVTKEHVCKDQSCSLSLIQRLSIAIDVAAALEYLHTECANPIIHCDMKPSNILLDDEMTARVGDFGLAKFLRGAFASNSGNQSSSTQVRGTIGYAAPEYGLGSNVSEEGDIYSFGIIVLEMMTSKKPTDPMFRDGFDLHDFAKSAFPSQVMEIIDRRMLGDSVVISTRNDADIRKVECINSLIMVGVQCSLEVPGERMNIKEVVNELKLAMDNLVCRRTLN